MRASCLRCGHGDRGIDRPAQGLDDGLHAGLDAQRHLAIAQMRDDDVLDDLIGGRVRQIALEAVAHLDPELVVLRCDEQDHAIVLALLSDAPAPAQGQPPILDGVAGEIRQGHDDELELLLLLEIRELRGDALLLGLVENLGQIHHPPRERRDWRIGTSSSQGDEQREKQSEASGKSEAAPLTPTLSPLRGARGFHRSASQPQLKFTAGTVIVFSSTVNWAISL